MIGLQAPRPQGAHLIAPLTSFYQPPLTQSRARNDTVSPLRVRGEMVFAAGQGPWGLVASDL